MTVCKSLITIDNKSSKSLAALVLWIVQEKQKISSLSLTNTGFQVLAITTPRRLVWLTPKRRCLSRLGPLSNQKLIASMSQKWKNLILASMIYRARWTLMLWSRIYLWHHTDLLSRERSNSKWTRMCQELAFIVLMNTSLLESKRFKVELPITSHCLRRRLQLMLSRT